MALMTAHVVNKVARPLLSVAPMMDYTDQYARYFLRLVAPDVKLYTEMVTTMALQHGDRRALLAFHPEEHPLALQLGGHDPKALAACARYGMDAGYDEINLNVGCPSSRVFDAQFGACLMLTPDLVAEAVAAMQAMVAIPVTVKCRLGVDDYDSYEHLTHFVRTVAAGGCKTFIIHARKAWLSGLSPKQNREVPPLDYARVAAIKRDFPGLTIIINGGIKTLDELERQLALVDGAMIGREAYHHPYFLYACQKRLFPETPLLPSREAIIDAWIPYVEEQLAKGVKLSTLIRPILGLFHGQPGARAWRRCLTEGVQARSAVDVILQALGIKCNLTIP